MYKETTADRLFGLLVYVGLLIIVIVVLYPLLYVLSASISNPELVVNGTMWLWPMDITLEGYSKIFHNKEILTGYGNTILYTVVGTAINIVMTILAAYPLSRKDFAGRGVITAMIVFTMFFSGGLIPTYLLVKNLHMMNTIWALVIPGAVSVWNIIIMRTFFQNGIPNEIQESASIDGCSNIGILWRIVLPLSMPIIAVLILFYSVGHWNSYFSALIYLTRRSDYPLQLILREILVQEDMNEMQQSAFTMNIILQKEIIKYAVIIVANLPILMLYPFLQRYFVKGVLVGAIKG
ncbi:ABC transporter permease subunit [Paenibacillus sp. LMG 31460]|uniref:ABC transporter permease subunit n=1 Tax=Paenibacillus germinis TaxID=2654979 RepID=A0ABX1YW53_9BACL|nr:carbohydrate ABC transporter permease [Paenibacillus germinis]NOU85333.1 ABC transporter permease subunit [Paenibacillus germinis]